MSEPAIWKIVIDSARLREFNARLDAAYQRFEATPSMETQLRLQVATSACLLALLRANVAGLDRHVQNDTEKQSKSTSNPSPS